MAEKYSPTQVTDDFPFEKLECPYFDMCRFYEPGKCDYATPCNIRQHLKNTLEDFVSIDSLNFQIGLIADEDA